MRNKSKKINTTRVAIFILIMLIIVAIITLIFKSKENKLKQEEMKAQLAAAQAEENITEAKEDEEENKEEENKQEENHLNNLADDEASFGKLDEPVYNINEKNIKIPLLIYHGFSTPIPDDDKYKLMCSKDIFEDQLTTLLDAGYTFITLEDLYKYKKGNIGLPEKVVAITMDDGWLGNYTEAFELIQKYKVPATIFIVEELVGTPGYFSWEQAKEMYDSGLVKIHVHGRYHKAATDYSKEKLIEDYNHTHSLVEEKLGAKVQKIMAYPAGDSSESTIKALKEAGFEVQVQTKYGTVNKSSSLDLTDLGRIRAERASGSALLKTIQNASVK